MSIKQSFSIKNTLILSAVVSCACELMLLLFVAFCLVTDVHKFYFKLVTNKTPNKWRTVGSDGFDSDVFWQDTVSSYKVIPLIRDPTYTVQVKAVHLTRQ